MYSLLNTSYETKIMFKYNHKFVLLILVIIFLNSFINLITNNESNGIIYGLLGYILFFDISKIEVYDYIFAGGAVLGAVLMFINIFYKNVFMSNLYSLFICGLTIFIYLKKSGINHE